MKKFPLLVLSLMTLPVYGQSILNSLTQYQDNLQSSENNGSSSSSSTPDVKPSEETISSTSLECNDNDQSSLPLAYVTSLIQKKNGQLDLIHKPNEGTLEVNSPDMISNCSSMLEWKLKQPTIENKKAYAIEVKIKSGNECTDQGCTYNVKVMEAGGHVKTEVMSFKPTLKGFEECLQKTGVIKDGKVVSSAIYPKPIKERFTGLKTSGDVLFLSRGPSSTVIKAKYGSFTHINGCDHYEAAHPNIRTLLTASDAENERLLAEAERLKECKVDEYHKVADFLEKYEGFSSELVAVRDRLILEAAKKAAQNISENKYTEDDLKVLGDFERYVVKPHIDLAHALYEEMEELEGDAKKTKQEELKQVLAKIAAFNKKPYFLAAHVDKLLADGRFEEAEQLNGIKLTLDTNRSLGSRVDNVVITPRVAIDRVSGAKRAFASSLPDLKLRYEYKTGQRSGNASKYASTAEYLEKTATPTRTANYQNRMRELLADVQQPNGYCYKYWRNTQKCVQQTVEELQRLDAELKYLNGVEKELIEENKALAKEWGELESQGRRYLAAQSGEETSAPVTDDASANTATGQTAPATPARREDDPGMYTFNFNQGNQQFMQQQQAQMTPQGYLYPTNPYVNNNMFQQQYNPYQQQYNPYMGQQSYGNQNMYGYQAQGGYQFGWNGGVQQQPNPYMNYQQQGYWQQPYQAYNMGNNMYGSVYGRTW